MTGPAPRTLTQETVVGVILRLRERLYPWMHIKRRADGTVVVTISPRPEGAE